MIRREVTLGLTISDNNRTGVGSVMAISQGGTARSFKVGIDITHTFIGDLRVELVAPSGRQAVLHNRTGGSNARIRTAQAV